MVPMHGMEMMTDAVHDKSKKSRLDLKQKKLHLLDGEDKNKF
jgi:hypothetical protein